MCDEYKINFTRGVLSACYDLYGYYDDAHKSVTIAILKSHGIDPKIDLEQINEIFGDQAAELITRMKGDFEVE